MTAVPDFLYGTAWKEDRTPALTELALRTGFRGIDTANQRRRRSGGGVNRSYGAAEYAAWFARMTRASVHVVHVIANPADPIYEPGEVVRWDLAPQAEPKARL